ncbi:MAG: DMT family transporter [Archangium sp.]
MLSRTLALLAATAVWGGTFVTVKDALDASDTFTFLAWRFLIGAVAAAAMALVATRSPAEWKRVLEPGLQLGVLLYAGYALQTLGLETTTPARSAFVTGLTVLFVPFVTWGFTKQRPQARAFIAPVLALFGLQRLTGVTWGDALPLGDVLTLGCAVAYAFHISATSRLGEGLPALPLTAVQLSVVSLLSGFSIPFVQHRFAPTPAYWGAVLFTGIVASALAIGVQVWAQKSLSAVRAAVIYALEPVFALLWSAMSGLGWPSASELVGGAFILLAVLVSEVRFGSSPERTSTGAPG